MTLIDFCKQHSDPAASVTLRQLTIAFGNANLAEDLPPRSVLIAQLAVAGYTIGVDRHGQTMVAGVSLDEPKLWIVRPDGRLVRAPAGTRGDCNVVNPATGRTPGDDLPTGNSDKVAASGIEVTVVGQINV